MNTPITFEVGQAVRTRPDKNGNFHVGIVEGFILDLVEMRVPGEETAYPYPADKLELYSYSSPKTTFAIGDLVHISGVPGQYEVLDFCNVHGHLCANLLHSGDGIPIPVKFIRKVQS